MSVFFSRFMGNESQCGTNKSRDWFVCSTLRFISHEPRKKDTHSLYLQCLQQIFLLKFSEQSKIFKFPSEIGNLTLFPDKTIHAYSFSQNSAWINGEKGDLSCMFFNSHFYSNNINSILEFNYMNFFYKMKFCHITSIPSAGPPSAPFQPIGGILIGRRELQEQNIDLGIVKELG